MNTIPVLPASHPPPPLPQGLAQDVALRDAAQKLEATFLAEMLKSAGLDAMAGAFGGGVGEDQFASFMREAQAEEMVKAGGIGLAEAIYNAMRIKADAV
ncbi:Rod binding protein [Cognatiyoonia koreensis]|uniref:Rod binding protein n=1 Tax=Cognatiyoonia koreensis TaxID=364200 RepID=A0A1I0RJL0_9RHOB|nr:rod-binding protein [Cognatiyoonia koreensis]SEW41178.1 Rod binding protein [Cognatiyoonia koreensis]